MSEKREERFLDNAEPVSGGALYIVATPIGNLEDITLRALRVLREVDVLFCEDTRVTKKLLARHGISVPTRSYHARSKEAKENEILAALRDGKKAALVSDAGTPTVSDPGAKLVSRIREELPDVPVIPIPGPSAVVAALSGAGFPASDFLFLGFLPHKKGRSTLFREIADSRRTVVFYESPHRIMKTLQSLATHLPAERKVALARELTKIHEEFRFGTPAELIESFAKRPDSLRGEFVVIVAGA